MTEFLRLLRYAKPYRGRLAAAFAAMVVYGAASAVLIYWLRHIIDAKVAGEEITPGQYGLTTFPGTSCSDAKPCTWSAVDKQVNRQQNGNQDAGCDER